MAQPQFEAQEVLQAIEMEKSTTFVVVEGDEVDVFDNVLRGMLGKKGEDTGWVVVSGADKETILHYFRNTKGTNAFAVLDHDFTGQLEEVASVSYLDRYSIENYLFDEMVVRQTSARLFKKTCAQIDMRIEELVEYYQERLSILLHFIKSYQTAGHSRSVAWSERSILMKDCWTVNADEINKLVEEICSDLPSIATSNMDSVGDVKTDFPAKLMVRGVYYFVKKSINPPRFTKLFNNEKLFMYALFDNLEYSKDFVAALKGARDFLVARGLTADN